MNNLLVSLFRYKQWANNGLHVALEKFDDERHPEKFQSMLQTLDHAHVVDRIFQGHLSGTGPAFHATHSEHTPGLQALRQAVSATDLWYLEFVSTVSAERLGHRIHFTFTDGDKGAMSCEEMLGHVIAHAAYHRGSVAAWARYSKTRASIRHPTH